MITDYAMYWLKYSLRALLLIVGFALAVRGVESIVHDGFFPDWLWP